MPPQIPENAPALGDAEAAGGVMATLGFGASQFCANVGKDKNAKTMVPATRQTNFFESIITLYPPGRLKCPLMISCA